ncbi:MAG: KamA family radical SAM protein [Pirellulales bacterium]
MASAQESQAALGFSPDPVGDEAAEVLPGLLQKYTGRALMIVSGACAVHCRYCFRRAFPYSEAPKTPRGWQAALDYLAGDDSISEIILSGGDPLAATDEQLGWLSDRLSEIPHLKRLRIHSRFPIVIPQRVCDALMEWIGRSRSSVYLVVHANHPHEIDDAVRSAMIRMRKAGVTLLNQAVLLRGVNDSVEVQEELCRQLVDIGVIPYYLHQLDRVQGAAHFETQAQMGRNIIEALRARLPGYAVPGFVREVAGDVSKRPL